MAASSSWRNRWMPGMCLAMAVAANAQQAPAPAAMPKSPPSSLTAQAAAQGIVITEGGSIHGTVVAGTLGKPGTTPLPGVAVTATNTLTGKKYTAATDIDGKYTMKIPKNGRYVVRAELTGFASVTAEAVLTGDLATESRKTTSFGMELLSRAEAQEAKAEAKAKAASTTSLAQNPQGTLNLSLSGNGSETTDASAGSGNTGVTMPSLAAMNDSITGETASSGADAITISGQNAQMNGLANFSEDEIHQRIQDAMDRARSEGRLPPGADASGMMTDTVAGVMGGMMSGMGPGMGGGNGRGGGGRGGRGGGGGGRGSGAFRNFNPAQPHGSIYYQGDFSGLDSAPWSPLRAETNPSYIKNSFGASFIGSPYLPGLTQPSNKQFIFINFSGKRDTTPTLLSGTVPTDAERTGDFSALAAQSIIYDPLTGNPFPNNTIPSPGTSGCAAGGSCISSQAQAILDRFYPHCNVNCGGTTQNYQTVTTAGQNSANVNARYVRNLGQDASNPFASFRRSSGPPVLRQNINASFAYSHSASDSRNIFLILGGATVSDGYNVGLGYTISYGRLNDNVSLNWNRSHAETRNYFTDTADDPTLDVGIDNPTTHAIGFRPNFYNGLPAIQMNTFSSITNTNPSDTISQTISVSDSVGWRPHHHSLHFGFDYRRVHHDSLGGANPLGTIVFTGYNTEGRTSLNPTGTGTGISFADFLLGLPQQSKLEAGLDKIYLRGTIFDFYAQDDFHVSDHVTINYGIRYDVYTPYTEKNGRLVNLTGVSEQTTSVGCVTPNGISVTTANGTLTCGAGPTASLIHPDRAMWSPRFGAAWAPKFLKNTVLRAGYGINYNTSQFSSFATRMSYQAPFAASQNNVLSTSTNNTGCTATTTSTTTNMPFASPFGCSNTLIQNSFAVNPNYRLGMVQIYNADIQHTFPLGIVFNLGYNGSHGNNLDVVRAPNQNFDQVTTPDAVAFTYEDSLGESTFNALTVNANKRLQKGVALGATYTYAHSIDDASTFGGSSSTSSIQNDADLHAERSNSSFDVRHKLLVSWVWEPPFGPNRAFLNKGGFWAAALNGFSISGSGTFSSGGYLTPTYTATTAQTSAGGTYTLRPDRVFSQPITGAGQASTPSNPSGTWFNKAAFVAPSGYGSASRYSIEGPGTVSVSAALSRTIALGDTRSLEARMTASNVFNTVQYSGVDTTVNSATFGQVTSAAAMRAIVFQARYRF